MRPMLTSFRSASLSSLVTTAVAHALLSISVCRINQWKLFCSLSERTAVALA